MRHCFHPGTPVFVRSSDPNSQFFELPAELRNRVYSFLIMNEVGIRAYRVPKARSAIITSSRTWGKGWAVMLFAINPEDSHS